MSEYQPGPLEQLRSAQVDVGAAKLQLRDAAVQLTRAQEAAAEALARYNREIGGAA